MPHITVNGNSLEPAGQQARLLVQVPQADAGTESVGLHTVAPDASKSDYVLVQTHAPLTLDQRNELSNLGLIVHKYVSEDTYLYGYKPSDLQSIRALPFVSYADVYPDYLVVSSDLKHELGDAPTTAGLNNGSAPMEVAPTSAEPIEVDITFHKDVDPHSNTVLSAVAAAAHVAPANLEVGDNIVRVSLSSATYLNALAAIDAVELIHRVTPNQFHNDVARGILQLGPIDGASSYQGAGQIVAVADTGVDSAHPAFTDRIHKLISVARKGKTDDPSGHGTHVSGSVLGDGVSQTLGNAANGGKIQGTAPKAKLIMQSLGGEPFVDSDGKQKRSFGPIPVDLKNLFQPAYDAGARVHTNSWGTIWRGYQQFYQVSSSQIDRFVRTHEDMVICFSAGNDGEDRAKTGRVADGELGEYAGAKNCIAVGASKSLRTQFTDTWGGEWPKDFPKDPIATDKLANNTNGMAAFSSRGPTNLRGKDGKPGAFLTQRLKPDLVAPGTYILSAGSSIAEENPWAGTKGDPWVFLGGTSMATPLVAGCAAVVRESLIKNEILTPTAALVKALLINGADPLPGQWVGAYADAGEAPNYSSGFGRVNVSQSTINKVVSGGNNASTPRLFAGGAAGFIEGEPLIQGREMSYPIKVPTKIGTKSPPYTFKVTLVWSDDEGDILQNDLDLKVIVGSTERHGNMGTSTEFDRVNNVEQVVWKDLAASDVTVKVNAYRLLIAHARQSYALTWRFY